MTVWILPAALYLAVALWAMRRTGEEIRRDTGRGPFWTAAGLAACAAWPLTLACLLWQMRHDDRTA